MTSLELQTRTGQSTEPSQHRLNDEENTRNNVVNEQSLAPVDGGAAAWRLLGVAFVFEALLWGRYTHPHFAIGLGSSQNATLTQL
jgi:hypothetical protein